MVNQKGVRMFIYCVLLSLFSISADAIEIDTPKASGYVTPYSHTFELQNKDKKPISLKVIQTRNFEDIQILNKKINTSARIGVNCLDLDPECPLTVMITDAQGKIHSYQINPNSNTLSVFVSFRKGKLVPQWGAYAGMSCYTKSGLPLVGNVKDSEIKKIS
jgi:hypothetical protein